MSDTHLIEDLAELACIMMQIAFDEVRCDACLDFKDLLWEAYEYCEEPPESLTHVLRKMSLH